MYIHRKSVRPLITIIIVNFNSRKYLRRCIQSIVKQKVSSEIFVIDNNSQDNSASYIKQKFPKIRLFINKSNLGFGRAVNQAVKFARGKFVLSINPDMTLGKNYLAELLSILEKHHDIGAIQGKIIYLSRNVQKYLSGLRFSKWGLFFNDNINSSKDYRKVFSIQVPIIRRSVFNKIGGYDVFYWLYYEDIDLSWRIWLQGLQVICYPKVSIYHKHNNELMSLNHLKYQQAINNSIYTFLKNYELPNLIKASVIRIIIAHLNFLFYLVRGNLDLSFMHIKAWIKTFSNIRKILHQRKLIQKQRYVSDDYIFSHAGKHPSIFNIYQFFLIWLKNLVV